MLILLNQNNVIQNSGARPIRAVAPLNICVAVLNVISNALKINNFLFFSKL